MNGGILMNKNLFLLLLTLSSTMLYSMEEQEVRNDQPASSKQENISESVRLWRLLNNDDKGFPSVLFITALKYAKQSNDAIDKLPIPSELKTYIIDIKNGLGKKLVSLSQQANQHQNIEFIINAGANINAQDKYGFTALMRAALFGHISLIQLLIKNDASLDLQNIYGQTALFLAACFHPDAAKLLIKKGANINHQTIDGDTALIKAARNGHKDIVELLIDKGADLNITNHEDDTALEIARANGQQDIINLLENAENKPGN